MQKFCTKCGKKSLSGNSFCVNCGNRNDVVPEPEAMPSGSAEKHSAGNALYEFLFFIIVMFVAIICLIAIEGIKGIPMHNIFSQNSPDAVVTQEDFSKPTNPIYLASPEKYIIDEKNDISDPPPSVHTKTYNITFEIPQIKKPVWVEDILDENTLKVSYIVSRNGESFLTFAAIHLYGLGDMGKDCEKEATISYLKSVLKGKNVYLSSYDYNGYEENKEHRESNEGFKSFAKKYPISSKKVFIMDATMSEQDLKDAIANRKFYVTKNLRGDVDVNKSILASGYGRVGYYLTLGNPDKLSYHFLNSKEYSREVEAAMAAKRGLWNADIVCNFIK